MTEAEQQMVEHWDSVSEAVLAFSAKHNVPPQYVIEEFCVDSEFPTEMTYE